jgi:hypothetical protein
LIGIGGRAAKVAKDIAAAVNKFDLLALHLSISFKVVNRLEIRSICFLGVVIPFVDFFWNACTTQTASAI